MIKQPFPFAGPISWSPTDQSGAALSLTVNAAHYWTIGNLCKILFDITYPSTANTDSVAISLPIAPSPALDGEIAGSGIVASSSGFSTVTTPVTISVDGGDGSIFNIFYSAGSDVTVKNNNLSGVTLRGECTYYIG